MNNVRMNLDGHLARCYKAVENDEGGNDGDRQ
jgi:hypothetical protein